MNDVDKRASWVLAAVVAAAVAGYIVLNWDTVVPSLTTFVEVLTQ